jgi:uncharacterized glyoxalase superfamily protein PhnB
MNVIGMSIVRHTRNYEAMLRFYGNDLGMKVVEAWDEPGNRGTLFSPGEKVGSAVIEVIELGEEAVPGVKPVNVALSIEVDDIDKWHGQLLRTGVTIARGLEDAPWEHRSFGVDDPDGFRIWFYQDIRGS